MVATAKELADMLRRYDDGFFIDGPAMRETAAMLEELAAKHCLAQPLVYSVPGPTTYAFEVEVIDLRSGNREKITINGNTRAGVSRKARELGYSVCSISIA